MMKRGIRVFCLILSVILFCISICKIGVQLYDYRKASYYYTELENAIIWIETMPEPILAPIDAPTEAPAEAPVIEPETEWVDLNEEELPLPDIDFGELNKVNPDIVCWLYCPDTVINYPVVQGADNEYYLRHLFDGTVNSSGCLFIDAETSVFRVANTVIYGHAMKDKSMFRSILYYREKGQAYYDAHPFLYLMLPDGAVYRVELFSGYLTDAKTGDAWKNEFTDEKDYKNWLISCAEKSVFQSMVSVSHEDTVVTLSTCSFERESSRFVVHGKLVPIRTGEQDRK